MLSTTYWKWKDWQRIYY